MDAAYVLDTMTAKRTVDLPVREPDKSAARHGRHGTTETRCDMKIFGAAVLGLMALGSVCGLIYTSVNGQFEGSFFLFLSALFTGILFTSVVADRGSRK